MAIPFIPSLSTLKPSRCIFLHCSSKVFQNSFFHPSLTLWNKFAAPRTIVRYTRTLTISVSFIFGEIHVLFHSWQCHIGLQAVRALSITITITLTIISVSFSKIHLLLRKVIFHHPINRAHFLICLNQLLVNYLKNMSMSIFTKSEYLYFFVSPTPHFLFS